MRPLEIILPPLPSLYLIWPHPRPLIVRLSPLAALILSLIHFTTEGYRWQMAAIYSLAGILGAGTLTMDINQARGIEEQMTNLENQLTNLRNQRDAINQFLWDKVKRGRAGVKANYGDDSSQYEMVGGTRLSERKSARRRTAEPA